MLILCPSPSILCLGGEGEGDRDEPAEEEYEDDEAEKRRWPEDCDIRLKVTVCPAIVRPVDRLRTDNFSAPPLPHSIQ